MCPAVAVSVVSEDEICIERKNFLVCLSVRRNMNSIRKANMAALRQSIGNLVALGVTRSTLRLWAVDAGYASASISSLLSRVFCSLGLRERKAGAGPKPTPEMRELAAYVRRRYKNSAFKTACGACRVLKALLAAEEPLIAPAIKGSQLTSDTEKARVLEEVPLNDEQAKPV